MGPLRYLLFIVVGLVVASVLFLGLSFVVSANFDALVSFVERRIVSATCDQYKLEGALRDPSGRPVPFAVVEASYLDERLTTRSNVDGTFVLAEDEAVCNRRVPRDVQLVVMADDFRPKRQAVPFTASSIEITLDPRELRTSP